MLDETLQNIFIIGSKGIPAAYGGFESFVDRLTLYRKAGDIRYHVACAVDRPEYKEENRITEYHSARCFHIPWKNIGPSRAVAYDVDALRESLSYIKKNKIKAPVIYILACRIGPFLGCYIKKIHKTGATVIVNPDGHEWKRSKWSAPVRWYWKLSERLMVKYADLLICDSREIEKYIQTEYGQYSPSTVYIAYGAETAEPAGSNVRYSEWCGQNRVRPQMYYLIVGRFVPENNFETMIREFMSTDTDKDLVIVTGTGNSAFYRELKQKTGFDRDRRVKFVGTVYDQELLKEIRVQAYGYIHGHEVGGTNPSLLEAMGSTKLNLLLDVSFNREPGGENCALYWTKNEGSLSKLINWADQTRPEVIEQFGLSAKKRIRDLYSWEHIVDEYEKVFRRIRGRQDLYEDIDGK